MKKNSITSNDYALSRVPKIARASFLNVTLVRIGLMTSLSQFMLGATLGHAMTFNQALLATFFGSFILELISLGLGLAGSREGLSTSLLARWCGFGRIGSALIGVVIAVSLLGWFGVLNAVFAKGLDYALEGQLGFVLAAIISGMAITVLVAFGFKALSLTAKVAVPLFFLVIGWIAWTLLNKANLFELASAAPIGAPLTLGAGITIVAGGCIMGSLITPDISRYCQNGWHVFGMTIISIILGEFVINAIAVLIARALNTSDIVTIMTQTAGGIGLLTAILSTIKINDINLYSSSLALANAVDGLTGKKWNRVGLTIVLGIMGTLLSIAGILDQFTHFIILLGVIFPPITGVMLVDYYILRTNRHLLDITRAEQTLPNEASTLLIGWPAIISCIVGSVIGFTIEWGIQSLNSLLIASVIYLFTASLVQCTHYNKKAL